MFHLFTCVSRVSPNSLALAVVFGLGFCVGGLQQLGGLTPSFSLLQYPSSSTWYIAFQVLVGAKVDIINLHRVSVACAALIVQGPPTGGAPPFWLMQLIHLLNDDQYYAA